MALITKDNLNESSLTNAEVIALLSKVAMELDPCGFSRVADAIEDLTSDRDFDEMSVIDEAKKSLSLKVVKSAVIDKF